MKKYLLKILNKLFGNKNIINNNEDEYALDFDEVVFLDGGYKSKSLKKWKENLTRKLENSDEKIEKFLAKKIEDIDKGIIGETEIEYHLSRSGIPMYVLRNVYIRDEKDKRSKAETDFILITKKLIFFIESKNFEGNIIVDESGFYREKDGKIEPLERNPLTQNEHHKNIVCSYLKTVLKREEIVDIRNRCRNFVVFTSHVMDKSENKEYVHKVMKNDMLIEKLQREISNSQLEPMSTKEIEKLVEIIMKKHEKDVDEDQRLYYGLMAFREGEMKKYNLTDEKYVFTNQALQKLISYRPQTMEELRDIKGFGDKNTCRHGRGILKIVKEYN